MAFWGAPVALPRAALHAAEAVLEILSPGGRGSLHRDVCADGGLSEGSAPVAPTSLEATPVVVGKRHRLQLRVGLHYGKCLVGNFGASGRWDYTVMGDVVNAASRLEALNKHPEGRAGPTGVASANACLTTAAHACVDCQCGFACVSILGDGSVAGCLRCWGLRRMCARTNTCEWAPVGRPLLVNCWRRVGVGVRVNVLT